MWANHKFFKLMMADTIWFLDHIATNNTSITRAVSRESLHHLQMEKQFISAFSLPLHSQDKPSSAPRRLQYQWYSSDLPFSPEDSTPPYVCYRLISDMFKNHQITMVLACSQVWHSGAGHSMILALSQCWAQFLSSSQSFQVEVQHISSCDTARWPLLGTCAPHCSPSPPVNQTILLQSGSCESEAVRFRYVQLASLPNK